MIDIEILRKKLNQLIEKQESIDKIYQVSVQLDKLIENYYLESNVK